VPSSTLLIAASSSEDDLSIFVDLERFIFVRKLKFASCHAPWKQIAGCKTIKQKAAMTIMAPSSAMKSPSSVVASFPLNPPASSTHRYTLRTNIVTVATARPGYVSRWHPNWGNLSSYRWGMTWRDESGRRESIEDSTCSLPSRDWKRSHHTRVQTNWEIRLGRSNLPTWCSFPGWLSWPSWLLML